MTEKLSHFLQGFKIPAGPSLVLGSASFLDLLEADLMLDGIAVHRDREFRHRPRSRRTDMVLAKLRDCKWRRPRTGSRHRHPCRAGRPRDR